MSTTTIEWTDKVWNPTTGCDRVSPGCDRCYALPMAKRLKAMETGRIDLELLPLSHAKYQTDGDPRTSGPGFGIAMHERELATPLKWTRPRKVFVNSMSDLFHDGVTDEFLAQVFAVMAATPQHTYQVLTKRHGRMRSLLRSDAFRVLTKDAHAKMQLSGALPYRPLVINVWPLKNVWLGVSVEDQKRADLRIPALLDTPAAVRFLSCEPLLGPVNLTDGKGYCRNHSAVVWEAQLDLYVGCPDCYRSWSSLGVDWVIAGGESGPSARPMHPNWVRTLRDQCADARVPFFFKQWGESLPLRGHREHLDLPPAKSDRDWSRPFGGDVTMCRVGKKAAGRELDGRTHDEFPQCAA